MAAEKKPATQQMDNEAFHWATRLDGGLAPPEQAELDQWLAGDANRAWRLAHYEDFYAAVRGSVPVLDQALLLSQWTPPARASGPVRGLVPLWIPVPAPRLPYPLPGVGRAAGPLRLQVSARARVSLQSDRGRRTTVEANRDGSVLPASQVP